MNFEEDHLGYVFEGDYPESYDEAETARLRAILDQQIGRLGPGDPESDARLLGILEGRRSKGSASCAQIERRFRRDRSLSLLARGELLMSAEDYKRYADRVEKFDAPAHPAGGRTGNVCLRRSRAHAGDIDRLIDQAGAMKLAAYPNYLATMAAVGKGIGGPENVSALPEAEVAKLTGPKPGRDPVTVAVIDTGIPAAKRGDHVLDDVRRQPKDNIDELDVFPSGPDGWLDYQAGHGTFVAGVVRRVAPAARIVMYRAADSDGFATDHDIAEAILRAHEDGAKIINLSLGLRTVDDQPPPAIAEAVARVKRESKGETVLVAAAGNNGDASKVWPAALEDVEAVAGLTAHLTPSAWSSYGDNVRFSTVAEGIRSTYVKGTESPVFDPSPDEFGADAWAFWSGTSFAAPQIAGAIARICDELGETPREAVKRLDKYGRPTPGGFGKAMRILQGLG
jgi:hypothetical protein